MKKNIINKMLIFLTIIFLLIIVLYPTFNAKMIKDTKTLDLIKTGLKNSNHHTVLGEQGTATWCPHCPSMGYWLSQVSGDFVYVALVADKSGYASQRCTELGIVGYPTTFFDGGYTEVVGHQYNVNNLQNAYDQCQARTVNYITITIGALINEDTDELEVITFLDNNEDIEFNGQLRVYVCEKESRWIDYDGEPYENAFIGWAPNTQISIPAQDSISKSGSLTFPDITADNILIVAAVFDSTDNYIQEVATTTPISADDNGGGADYIPPVIKIESPVEDEIVNGTINIKGSAHHPKGDGNLKWTYIKINNGDWIKTEGSSKWEYSWNTSTVEDGICKIQAITSDGTLQSAIDQVNVLVNNYGNFPPFIPSLPMGPETGKAGNIISYMTCTEDPNDNDIRYGWDINSDDIVDIWTEYYKSEENIETNLSWGNAGTYQLKVKAEDVFGNSSDFSDALVVEITGINQAPSIPFIEGATEGIIEEPYQFTATSSDPEKTNIWYLFDWGDGKDSGWRGPYESGESLELGHTYRSKDTFELKVKTKDIHDKESEWGTISISIPKSKILNFQIFDRLLDMFPIINRVFEFFF